MKKNNKNTTDPVQLMTHNAHTKQANKVLSVSESTEDSKTVALIATQVSELQDSLMEMSTMVGKMSDIQY
jgi:hypothetical protein